VQTLPRGLILTCVALLAGTLSLAMLLTRRDTSLSRPRDEAMVLH
jgi:hypothetical protein